ncbi:hypothetical protein DAPPUDRAFT_65490, partial [Daphnia pulex]
AMNLLEQGRRYLHVSDLPSAIAALAESAELLVKRYGANADECAESFYYLGMAFHEKHRADSCVLDEPFTYTIRPLSLPSGDKAEEEDGESEDEKNGDEEESEEEDVSEKSTNGDKVDSVMGDDDDEKPILELAWKMFEQAKQIYESQNLPTLFRLAEVELESENFDLAIEDLQKYLKIQKASLPPDSRSMSETYYKLGVAFASISKFKDAVRSFESSAKIVQHRINILK